MESTPAGIEIETRVEAAKAASPMCFRPFGRAMDSAGEPEKAPEGMLAAG